MSRLSKCKQLKRFLLLGTCVVVSALILSSCTLGPKAAQDPQETPADAVPLEFVVQGKDVYAPVRIDYLVDNPLVFTTFEESKTPDHQRFYVQVEGLLDETIESKLNEAIKALYQGYLPYVEGEKMPPYRGFMKHYDPSIRMTYSYLQVMPQFNANNILSLSVHVNVGYNNASMRYWSLSDGLTFDLNTGELLTLADVFTNDADVNAIVSDAIMEEMKRRSLRYGFDYYDTNDFSLVAPFKSILPSQKFYLLDNALVVIVDHEMPEFNTDFQGVEVRVPIAHGVDSFALSRRFFDKDKQIFKTMPFEKHFVMHHYYDGLEEEMIQEFLGENWNLHKRYPKSMSEALLVAFDDFQHQETLKLKERLKDADASYVEQNFYVQESGLYYKFVHSNYYNLLTWGAWEEKWQLVDEVGNQIRLESLFKEDFDYKGVIFDALALEISQYSDITPSNAPSPELFWENLQFSLGEREFIFVTEAHPWQKYYSARDESAHPLYFRVPYRDFGYDNLTLFP